MYLRGSDPAAADRLGLLRLRRMSVRQRKTIDAALIEMNTRNEQGLYRALEKELRKAKDPMECAALFDLLSVREHAETVNRVSDYLGNMWRKGQVLRLPAPRLDNTRARWLYIWKNKGPAKKPVVDLASAVEFSPALDSVLNRANMSITEEGDTVVITLPAITITIKQNR